MRRFSQKKVLGAVILLVSILMVRSAGYNKPAAKSPMDYRGLGGEGYAAQVKRVVDGDTIVLDTGERIRYIGINAPEIHHPQKGIEYCGPQASDFNKRLVLGKTVRLEFDQERFDRYGRTLAYLYLQDGTFVNAELVRQGYARTMTIRPNTKYADLFGRLQDEAKAKKLGVWAK
jgi:micrococcal nuclease